MLYWHYNLFKEEPMPTYVLAIRYITYQEWNWSAKFAWQIKTHNTNNNKPRKKALNGQNPNKAEVKTKRKNCQFNI